MQDMWNNVLQGGIHRLYDRKYAEYWPILTPTGNHCHFCAVYLSNLTFDLIPCL